MIPLERPAAQTQQRPDANAILLNLVLFEPDELGRALPPSDLRAQHLATVLRRRVGDRFDAGVTDGRRGEAVISEFDGAGIHFEFLNGPALPPRATLVLWVALPRPQTARDILRDATTLGATELHFITTSHSDANYAKSTLWSSGEWRRHVCAGASQAFDPRLPRVTWTRSLADCSGDFPPNAVRLAPDVYEASRPLWAVPLPNSAAVVVAIGPERGWSNDDRAALRTAGFELVSLGPRVLRTETAVTAALTLVTAARDRV